MITIDDWGETHCTYTTCSREFCEGEICYAGLYQCPHMKEMAKALLSEAINDLEDFKSRSNGRHDNEYYEDLAYFESKVNEYKRLADGKKPYPTLRIKNTKMKSFTEAYNYIKNTTAKDIATRTAIFGAYINMWMHKNLGHDIILDIVAALYGPFDYDFPNDTKIMEMLDTIHYGFDKNWSDLLWKWVCANAASQKELMAFDNMVGLLVNGKCDEILVHFNYICKEIQPSSAEYFPEMETMAGLYAIKKWPRI